MIVQNVLEKNATEILHLNQDLYQLFSNVQKCAVELDCKAYVFGFFIQEKMTHQKGYNPGNVIEILFTSEDKSQDLKKNIETFFDSPQRLCVLGALSYRIHNFDLEFYFVPDFSPHTINTDFGFTIDQIYYDIKENKLIDCTKEGMNHLTSSPIVLKSTVPQEKWDLNILELFVMKFGSYYNSKIHEDDYEKLKQLDFVEFNNFIKVFWLNKPGSAMGLLFNLFPQSKKIIFNELLKILFEKKISMKESINPLQVFSEEKLNLLNLYGEYFASSATDREKRDRDTTLVKLLIDS